MSSLVMPAQVALASDLDKIIIGVGGAILLKDALDKEQKKARKSPSSNAKPAASGPMAKNKALPRQTQRAVQENLNAMGFDAGRPDGVWGPRTQRAFVAFENNTDGAVRDGVADVDEIALLAALSGGSDEGAVASVTPVAVAPAPTAAPQPVENGSAMPTGMGGNDGAVTVAQTETPAAPIGPLAAELVTLLPQTSGAASEPGLSYADFGLGVYESEKLRLVVTKRGALMISGRNGNGECVFNVGDRSVDDLLYLETKTSCLPSNNEWMEFKIGAAKAADVKFPSQRFDPEVLSDVSNTPVSSVVPKIKITGVPISQDFDATVASLASKNGQVDKVMIDVKGFGNQPELNRVSGQWRDANFYYATDVYYLPDGVTGGLRKPVAITAVIEPLELGGAPFQKDVVAWLEGLYGAPSQSYYDGREMVWRYDAEGVLPTDKVESFEAHRNSNAHWSCYRIGKGRSVRLQDLKSSKENIQRYSTKVVMDAEAGLLDPEGTCSHYLQTELFVQGNGQVQGIQVSFSDAKALEMLSSVRYLDRYFREINVPAKTPYAAGGSVLPTME